MPWRDIANTFLSTLLEPACASCSRVLLRPLEGAVCDDCWASVRLLARPAVERRSGTDGLDCLCAIGDYDGCLRNIIHALKYERRRSVAAPLGALMRTAGRDLLDGADLVTPVPLHRRRERSRGFNQADDLARALGLPVHALLRRVIATRPQVDLPATERSLNVRDAFVLAIPTSVDLSTRWLLPTRSFLPTPTVSLPSVNGKVIVVVDDVSTTGATLQACARVLKTGGAREVRALTAARVATEPR